MACSWKLVIEIVSFPSNVLFFLSHTDMLCKSFHSVPFARVSERTRVSFFMNIELNTICDASEIRT